MQAIEYVQASLYTIENLMSKDNRPILVEIDNTEFHQFIRVLIEALKHSIENGVKCEDYSGGH